MRERSRGRHLAVVLFTDVIDSTLIAGELDDARWRELLHRHHRILRASIAKHGGRLMDTAGDGFFVSFDEPGAAVRCARDAIEGVRELGIEIRAGINMGGVEQVEEKVGGIAVHTGARIMGAAGAGEILVSQTIHDLLAGSGIAHDDRGSRELKGLSGPVHLHAVTSVDGRKLEPPLDPETARERRRSIEPSSERKERFRRPVLIGAPIVVAALALGIWFLARGDETSAAPPTNPPPSVGNTIIRIDAETLEWEPIEGFALSRSGAGRRTPAVGVGALWTADAQTIKKVDLDTLSEDNPILITDKLGQYPPIAVGFGRVWAVSENFVTPVDPAEEKAGRSIRLSQNFTLNAATTGFGAVWIGHSDGTLYRLDPTQLTFTTIDLDGTITDIEIGTDRVWVVTADGELQIVDPKGREPVEHVDVSGSPSALAVGGGKVWVVDPFGGSVTVFNEDTGENRSSISEGLGPRPTDISYGLGYVWVVDQEDGSIRRIDPETLRVVGDPILVGAAVVGVAADEEHGAIWAVVGRKRTPLGGL